MRRVSRGSRSWRRSGWPRPLAVALGAAYRYRLDGREIVDGQDCYVVAFQPMDASRHLLRGRAWIAARGFAMVRAEAVQAGLRGPIVSSQQRDVFSAVPVGQTVAWLLSRSEVHQVYEGPGHRTAIDRVLAFTRLEADPADFGARRAAAHASESVLVADTAEGLRYLRRPPAAPGAVPPPRENAGASAQVKTVAVGVLVDPNISRPLPFAGLSYLDFDFLGTGAQVNASFGGAFAQLAWTVPSLLGSRWQAHGTGFAVLGSYNDRAFSGGLERYEENLRQRPARLALGVGRPLGDATRLRVEYELEYTRLARADTTAPEFVVPVSPVVHGIRVALEAQRGPWSASAWWNGAHRQRWAPWGLAASEPGAAGFQRFGASAARSFVLSAGAVARLDAAWMGGYGLDRFSRYAFDGFENRLRGYPSATIRYDRGGVARGALTWNAGKRLRLDGFVDAARVRDPGPVPGRGHTWAWGPASRPRFRCSPWPPWSGGTAPRPAVDTAGPGRTSCASPPTRCSDRRDRAVRLRGVILDVDGTLVDSNDAHARAWVEALKEGGFDVPFERVRPLIGMGGVVAYRTTTQEPLGEVVVDVKQVRFNVDLPAGAFGPRGPAAAR